MNDSHSYDQFVLLLYYHGYRRQHFAMLFKINPLAHPEKKTLQCLISFRNINLKYG